MEERTHICAAFVSTLSLNDYFHLKKWLETGLTSLVNPCFFSCSCKSRVETSNLWPKLWFCSSPKIRTCTGLVSPMNPFGNHSDFRVDNHKTNQLQFFRSFIRKCLLDLTGMFLEYTMKNASQIRGNFGNYPVIWFFAPLGLMVNIFWSYGFYLFGHPTLYCPTLKHIYVTESRLRL